MDVLIIGNPIAGRGKAVGCIKQLQSALEQRGYKVGCHLTHGAGDAQARAANIESHVRRIVSVGGDGTLNEILNGLPDPTTVALAQLPMGTANLLARELSLPRDPEAVADLVRAGRTRRVDMGLLGNRRFLSVASCGFDAMVIKYIQDHRTGRLGLTGYLWPILRTLVHYDPPRLRIRVDNQTVNGSLVVVSNSRHYGGLFSVTDRAICDSGQLDVVVFPSACTSELMRYVIAARRRRVSQLPRVPYLTGRQVQIEADEPVPIEVDGDFAGTTPAHMTIQPVAVSILVPEKP